MNKRIEELIEQADLKAPGGQWKEYFAKSIVKECVSLCEDLKMQNKGYRMKETDFGMKNIYAEGEATCEHLQHKMKQHFGVEE